MTSTKYFTEISMQKTKKYLKVWKRKTRIHSFASLIPINK